MAAYAVIPGGPSPEMNPGCSGPFIILDPDTACLYVWDSFEKEYVPYCLDETFAICSVPERPLEDDTLVFTCTPGSTPQEGKASITTVIEEFFSRLCAISGDGITASIVEQTAPGGQDMWCVSVSVNIGNGRNGIGIDPDSGAIIVDACNMTNAVISDISDNDLCAIRLMGHHIGPGSECLNRTFDFGELYSRYLIAGTNIAIEYDPITCRTTITGTDTTLALTPGYGTVPGADGTSVDLSICGVNYTPGEPPGARVLACVAGETVLLDYTGGGGAGDGIIVIDAEPGITSTAAAGPGPDDVTYTLALDLCGLDTVTRQEVSDAIAVFIPLCVDGESKKILESDFHELTVTTITSGEGIDSEERENVGGSSDYLISLDLCGLIDATLQDIISAPAGSVYMAMCVDGNNRKLVDSDIHAFLGTTVAVGQGLDITESVNQSGSRHYALESDLCGLVTADIQEIINAPADSVFFALCVGGVDKKLEIEDVRDLAGNTVSAGSGIDVAETTNPSGSTDYQVSSNGASRKPIVTVYDTPGVFTHNFDASRTWCKIIVTGAGGGGDISSTSGTGGGAGGTAIATLDIVAATASIDVAIDTDVGGDGNDSIFMMAGSQVIGQGGPEGTIVNVDFIPATGINGDINIRGGSGTFSSGANLPGQGGASYWGGGVSQDQGASEYSYGAYGCGGRARSSGQEGLGGMGGIIVIEEY